MNTALTTTAIASHVHGEIKQHSAVKQEKSIEFIGQELKFDFQYLSRMAGSRGLDKSLHLCHQFTFHPIGRNMSQALQDRLTDEFQPFNRAIFPVSYSHGFYEQLMTANNIVAIYCRDKESRKLVAMITTRITEEQPPSPSQDQSSTQVKRMAYIMTLGVLKQHENKGLGTFLLHAITKILLKVHKVDLIALDVLHSNTKAAAMYQRSGYKHIFTRDNYYLINGKHYDAQHMQLENINKKKE